MKKTQVLKSSKYFELRRVTDTEKKKYKRYEVGYTSGLVPWQKPDLIGTFRQLCDPGHVKLARRNAYAFTDKDRAEKIYLMLLLAA